MNEWMKKLDTTKFPKAAPMCKKGVLNIEFKSENST